MNATDNYDLAVDLIGEQFSRCPNYPRDGRGLSGMAHALIKASETTGVSMSAIVERCAETDFRCPTNYEMRTAAEAIAGVGKPQFPVYQHEKDRVPEAEFRELLKTVDLEAAGKVHEKRIKEHRAVLAEARKTSDARRRMPTAKLASSIQSREYAEIKKRLGFELNQWDKENLA